MKTTILYFYPYLSTFVKKDIKFFQEKHNVVTSGFMPKKKSYTPFFLIKQFFFILFNIGKSKIVICKFASYHSFLPALLAKIFNKPFILINGGTDCVSFPSINYGNFNKNLQGKFTKWTYQLTSHIATLHQNLVEYDYNYQDADFPKQGFAYHVKNLNKPISEIYNGYDADKWHKNSRKIPNSFITVAFDIGNERTNYLKGIDLILDLSVEFPDCKFCLIGANKEFIKKDKPKNIEVLPFLPSKQLIEHYSKSEFYLQLSISEGFPNSLCEAMLCECIPIGSDVGAIPFIIGDTGFILKKKDKNQLTELINNALKSDRKTLQTKARNRIATEFTEEKRKEKLQSLIESLI